MYLQLVCVHMCAYVGICVYTCVHMWCMCVKCGVYSRYVCMCVEHACICVYVLSVWYMYVCMYGGVCVCGVYLLGICVCMYICVISVCLCVNECMDVDSPDVLLSEPELNGLET
jgi:hypothetical protein